MRFFHIEAMTHPARMMVAIAAIVLVLHAAALWALNVGMRARTPEKTAPVPMLARIVEPPQASATVPPAMAPHSSIAPGTAAPIPTPILPKPAPIQAAAGRMRPKPELTKLPVPPLPVPALATVPPIAPAPAIAISPATVSAEAEPASTPVAPAVNTMPGAGKPASPRTTSEPAAALAHRLATAAIRPTPPPTPVELPSSDAEYLQNPRPRYPPISLRLREQGTVLVDVLVSDQGLAKEAKVRASSGFFRLDNAAESTVLTWRFVPGKHAGVAQSMWFTVPITFAIQ